MNFPNLNIGPAPVNRNAELPVSNFQLEMFILYIWPHYYSQSEVDQRRIMQWLLSPSNGKGSRQEQNLKLELEPALAFLLKSNKNIRYADENGKTILHLLFTIYVQNKCPRNERLITLSFTNAGASIIAVDHNGDTPLGLAIAKNRLDVIKFLPFHLRNINERNSLGESALHIVLKTYAKEDRVNCTDKCEYQKIIRNFISVGANYNMADDNGITPVHYAAMKFYLAILKMLKGRRGDVHCITNNGDNLLILACKNITMADDNEMIMSTIEWLLGQGYDVNYRNRGGHTALHYAAQSGYTDVVLLLIEHGADIKVVGLDGATPLHAAIVSSHFNTMDNCVLLHLLKQGADINCQEKVFGFGIEHLAAFNRSKIVVFHKNFVNRQSKSGLTPLHLAAASANIDVALDLIELGASVHCRENTYGYTPLHFAAMRGQFRNLDDMNILALEGQLDMNEPNLIKHCFGRLNFRTKTVDYKPMIDLLLQAGAEVNAKDTRGRTPLHCAIQQQDETIVEKLLNAGAHVDAVDNENRVPLQYAIVSIADNWSVIECLLRYGADIDAIETNIRDIYTQSKIYKFAIADRLLRHMAKQECIGLRTKNFYIPQYKKPRIDNFRLQYMKEIRFMKKRMLNESVSLYDMLHMTTKQRVSLLDDMPSDIEIKVTFPNYRTIICGRYYEAVQRESMLGPAKSVCNFIMRAYWPDLCVHYVFSFLRNRDLRALVDSVCNA